MPDTTADALVNAMNAQSERSVLGQFGLGIGGALGYEEARRLRDDRAASTVLSDRIHEVDESVGIIGTAVAVQNEKIGAAINLAVGTAAAQARNDAINFSNLAAVQAERIRAELGAKADANAAAGVLLATQNQAAIQAALAECCCELKERIHAEGEETRDLISANTVQDLRERLTAANGALLSLKAQVIV